MFTAKKIHLAVATCCLAATPAFAEDGIDYHVLSSPVVVTATRIEQNSFDLPVSIDVVGSDIINDSQQQVNLSEISVRVPGIVVNNRYNPAQELSISTRGFGARSQFGVRGVRLYADGIPMSMPDGMGQTGTFNLDSAKQVEFMRGPFSALYGNSSGGIVQILTKDGAQDPTLSAGITFGSYNTRREKVTVEDTIGGFNYIATAAHIESDGYRDHSEFTQDTFHTKLSYKPSDDTKLTVLASYLKQPDSKDPGGLTPTQFRQDPKQTEKDAKTVADANPSARKTHAQMGIALDHAFSDSNSIRLMAYYGIRDNISFQTLVGSFGSDCDASTAGKQRCYRAVSIDREFGGADARWTYKDTLAGRPFSFIAGLNYDTMRDDRRTLDQWHGGALPDEKRYEIQDVHNLDQYAQATFEPTDRWLLVAGLRHTKLKFNVDDRMPVSQSDPDGSGSLEFSKTIPVIGATFKVTPAFNVYANYGEGFETPTFIELTYDNPSTGTGPNLGMKPGESKNYEVGAKAILFDNTRVNLALFKVDTKKEIAVKQGTGTTASFQNAGDTKRYGLELSLDSALPHNFNVYAAYTLMNAEFKDAFTYCGKSATKGDCASNELTTVESGNKIPGVYTSSGYAEISWKHPASGFSTALEGIYMSDVYTDDLNRSAYKADAYTLFNLRGGFTQHLSQWRLNEFVRVNNLGDRKYVSSVRINNDAAFEPGAGRSYTLGLNASYQF